MSIKSHGAFFDGARRPHWAGPVTAVSRQRNTGLKQVTRSTELSGLVLPVSSAGSGNSFGRNLGFPHLGEQMPDVHPDLLKNWGRLEQLVSHAATGVMGWSGPRPPKQASGAGAPRNALRLKAVRQTVTSTGPKGSGQPMRPDVISGEISKVFAIRDVSGTHLRFESAGAAATFQVTPTSLHLSRDPGSL